MPVIWEPADASIELSGPGTAAVLVTNEGLRSIWYLRVTAGPGAACPGDVQWRRDLLGRPILPGESRTFHLPTGEYRLAAEFGDGQVFRSPWLNVAHGADVAWSVEDPVSVRG